MSSIGTICSTRGRRRGYAIPRGLNNNNNVQLPEDILPAAVSKYVLLYMIHDLYSPKQPNIIITIFRKLDLLYWVHTRKYPTENERRQFKRIL